MPFDALTNADNFRIMGSMTVINDPNGNNGNVNIAGNITASGTASFASMSSSFVSGLTVSGGETVSGGLTYDAVQGGTPSASTVSQALASGGTITMTGSGRIIYVSCSDTSETTIKLTPTTSTATSGTFANGLEITVVNLSVSGTNVVIPPSSGGAFNSVASTISGGCASKFMYIAALNSWIKQI